MRRTCLKQPARMITGLLAGLLFAVVTIQPGAQTAADSRVQGPSSPGYDKAHEITLNGTVQEVVTKRVAGSPVGMHLLVAGKEGTVDVHLGAFLTQDTQEALHAGAPVEIVGSMTTINGKDYLLARQLVLGGHSVTVRTERGFLVHSLGLRAPSIQTETNGGAR
jgi:hypothetical protein